VCGVVRDLNINPGEEKNFFLDRPQTKPKKMKKPILRKLLTDDGVQKLENTEEGAYDMVKWYVEQVAFLQCIFENMDRLKPAEGESVITPCNFEPTLTSGQIASTKKINFPLIGQEKLSDLILEKYEQLVATQEFVLSFQYDNSATKDDDDDEASGAEEDEVIMESGGFNHADELTMLMHKDKIAQEPEKLRQYRLQYSVLEAHRRFAVAVREMNIARPDRKMSLASHAHQMEVGYVPNLRKEGWNHLANAGAELAIKLRGLGASSHQRTHTSTQQQQSLDQEEEDIVMKMTNSADEQLLPSPSSESRKRTREDTKKKTSKKPKQDNKKGKAKAVEEEGNDDNSKPIPIAARNDLIDDGDVLDDGLDPPVDYGSMLDSQ